jgi:hypothetical protein
MSDSGCELYAAWGCEITIANPDAKHFSRRGRESLPTEKESRKSE